MQKQKDIGSKKERIENIKRVLSFFKEVRQSGPSFNGAEAIRKIRDLSKY